MWGGGDALATPPSWRGHTCGNMRDPFCVFEMIDQSNLTCLPAWLTVAGGLDVAGLAPAAPAVIAREEGAAGSTALPPQFAW